MARANRVPRRALASALLALSILTLAWSARSAPSAGGGGDEDVEAGAADRIVAWNDLGMHCVDPDFSVFSILPPFNTLNAQLVVDGQLVTQDGGWTITYEGIADSTGSINTTSIGKTNFWTHVLDLFGVALPLDVGLAGNAMPGAQNAPQSMHFDGLWSWFSAEGIPIMPIDDALAKNPYPLMKVTARDASGQAVASSTTVVPTSQELQCSRCHASGTSPFARPALGWAYHPDPLKDDRLNILLLHDEMEAANPAYQAALAAGGYDPNGLYETVVTGGRSILCASCHGSNALPGTGLPGVSAMTSAIHEGHAGVLDEDLTELGDSSERASCYTCHPGYDTQCLRGAMGKAIGADGHFSMQCQSCHGSMADVGDPNRVGWLEQPNCQQCHTGGATLNNGEIRFTSVFDSNGATNVPVSSLFATTPDVPANGFSLYRFSAGHGGLQCSACHGPPHAIYPTNFANDNVQNTLIQGHAGTLTDCTACHAKLEDDEYNGPHGMHPVGQKWVQDAHKVAAEQGLAQCRVCHGADDRGSVLSRTQANRQYSTPLGMKQFWDGFQVGCYTCHDGPDDDDPPSNQAPVASGLAVATPADVPVVVALAADDPDGDPVTFRIVAQPAVGTVGWAGATATYYPEHDYVGPVSFTYAASDGSMDSNLAVVTVDVGAPLFGEVEPFGFGCSGAGDVVPTLTVAGDVGPGQVLTFTLSDARPGAAAFLVEGTDRNVRELGPGCVLRVDPIVALTPFLVTPTGPLQGTATIDVTLPLIPNSPTSTFQVFVRDPSGPFIGTFTNALEVRLP